MVVATWEPWNQRSNNGLLVGENISDSGRASKVRGCKKITSTASYDWVDGGDVYETGSNREPALDLHHGWEEDVWDLFLFL